MTTFESFGGIVTAIENFWTDAREPSGCFKFMSVRRQNRDTVNFVVSPSTYFVNHAVVRVRDSIVGFYDSNAPAPMIFPPQYRALVISEIMRNQTVVVDNFNSRLMSSDGTLQLNITRSTRIVLTNGQPFMGSLENRDLVVVYRSMAQNLLPQIIGVPNLVTPIQVIVLC